MKQGNVHAGARASAETLRRAQAKRKRKRAKPAAAKSKPKAQTGSAPSVKQRLHGVAHALSAGFSATLGVLALSAVLMASDESEASIDPRATFVSAPLRDVDFDGVGDFANPTDGMVRAHDVYGYGAYGASRDGGRRKHAGVDYTAKAGQLVRAPMSGRVTRVGHAYNARSGLNFVEIHDAERNLFARIFYVANTVRTGDRIAAGEEIGLAQDLAGRYPAGITNHVHVEILDERGVHVDPTLLLPLPALDVVQSTGASVAR